MKAIKFISAALIVFGAASCIKENITDNFQAFDQEPMTISNPETKTVLNSDYSVNWTAGDEIAIYDNLGGKNIFTNSTESVATFSGNVTMGTTQFWGIYPAGLVESFNNGTAVITLPADQTPAAGTFAEDVNISIAQGSKTPGTELVENITFSNVCGLISFEIPARIDAKKVTLTANNREIAGDLSINFEDETVSILANGSKSVSMTGDFPADSRFYFLVTPGILEGFRVEVITEKGTAYFRSANNASLNIEAGKVVELPAIDFANGAVTASASHIYENNILNGTSLSVNHGIPEFIWGEVTELAISISKDGKQYRSYSETSVTGTTVTPSGSVYLPQGTHTISGYYTINGVQTPIQSTFEVEAPIFEGTVEVTGTTSYDKYIGGDVTAANSHNAETISDITTSCTGLGCISDAVKAELPITYTISVDGTTHVTGTATPGTITISDKTNTTWGTRSLEATFTFDGVDLTKAITCHITGLPYKNVVPSNSGNNAWTSNSSTARNTFSWNSDGVKMEGISQKQTITSPGFHIPGSTNISLNIPTLLNSYCLLKQWAVPELVCRLDETEISKKSGEKGSSTWGASNNQIEHTISYTGTLSEGSHNIEVENTYTMASAYIYVYKVNFLYN